MESESKNIRLVKVDYFNFDDLIDLKVADDQKNYVASNIYSLAEAYAAKASDGYAMPFGIYLDDKPIGFIMFGYYPDLDYAKMALGDDLEIPDYIPKSYLLWRFMIDKEYQRNGYGKKLLNSRWIISKPIPAEMRNAAGFPTNLKMKSQGNFTVLSASRSRNFRRAGMKFRLC